MGDTITVHEFLQLLPYFCDDVGWFHGKKRVHHGGEADDGVAARTVCTYCNEGRPLLASEELRPSGAHGKAWTRALKEAAQTPTVEKCIFEPRAALRVVTGIDHHRRVDSKSDLL